MSSGGIEIVPGYRFSEDDQGETLTLPKLNKLVGEMVAQVLAGAITARELADGSISSDKLAAEIQSQLGLADGTVTTLKLVDGAVTTAKIADGAVTAAKLGADIELIPTGFVWDAAVSTVPAGWLSMNGQVVNKADYPALYAYLCDGGSACIYGETVSTFTMPDYRGRFKRAWDNGAGRDPNAATRTARGDGTGGDVVGSTQAEGIKIHDHGLNLRPPGTGGLFAAQGAASGALLPVGAPAVQPGWELGQETRPLNIYFNPVMKT